MTTSNTTLMVDNLYARFFTPGRKPLKARAEEKLAAARTISIKAPTGAMTVSVWERAGPSVLLVHGWGGDRTQMVAFAAPLLQAGYRVLAPDLPAHGASDGEQTNIIEMADALQLLNENEGPFEAVIAHSFGTLVTSFSLVHREVPLPKKLAYFGTLNRLMDTVERFQAIGGFSDPLAAALREKIEARFGAQFLASVANDRLAPQLELPALMFHDKKDLVTPVADSRAVAAAWPGAQLTITEGLGHRGALRAGAIIEQVVGFIGK
jgi:pimeloyl-ACP methyl ester carboxylesterase